MSRTLRIGLTGGIGTGKSTVAQILVRRGAALVDTDAIARTLTAPGGAALPALRDAFGPDVFTADGALDRARMRDLAFGDAAQRARLESILHPLIGSEAMRQGQSGNAPVIVYDVPLMTPDSRWRARVDAVLVVDCEEETQVERVLRRPGWERATVERVMRQQLSREQRRGLADAVIYNDALTLDELEREVDAVWQQWVEATL